MTEWFNSVTGTNDYERQSWRDSYNGGRAAGDLTGNVNARLDAERDAFQGATWSGSSTQYSALELARMSQTVGHSSGSSGSGSPKSSGPGNATVTQGPVKPSAPAGGAGPASRLTISTPDMGALTPDDKPLKRIGVGLPYESNGAISSIGWARTATGWLPVPSSDMKARIEDNFFLETDWFVRNYAGPMFGFTENQMVPSPPPFLDPEYTHYIPALNEYRAGKTPRRNVDGRSIVTGGGF